MLRRRFGRRPETATLLQTLEKFESLMLATEHCGDLGDLFAHIVELLETTGDDADTDGIRRELDRLLEKSLPLPAKGGPACVKCGLCTQLELRLKKWDQISSTPRTPGASLRTASSPGDTT